MTKTAFSDSDFSVVVRKWESGLTDTFIYQRGRSVQGRDDRAEDFSLAYPLETAVLITRMAERLLA